MYLIFQTYQEADARNRKGITDRNWPTGTTTKRWDEIECANGDWALNVSDGDGLTEQEISECVETITPKE